MTTCTKCGNNAPGVYLVVSGVETLCYRNGCSNIAPDTPASNFNILGIQPVSAEQMNEIAELTEGVVVTDDCFLG